MHFWTGTVGIFRAICKKSQASFRARDSGILRPFMGNLSIRISKIYDGKGSACTSSAEYIRLADITQSVFDVAKAGSLQVRGSCPP